MKKIATLLSVALLSMSAYAAEPTSLCGPSIGHGQQTGNKILANTNGGASRIKVDVVLQTDVETRTNSLTTLDGVPATMRDLGSFSYISGVKQIKGGDSILPAPKVIPGTFKYGSIVTVVPVLNKDGNIFVTYDVAFSDFDGMDTVNVQGVEIGLPHGPCMSSSGSVELKDGKEVTVLVSHSGHYALKITATKT